MVKWFILGRIFPGTREQSNRIIGTVGSFTSTSTGVKKLSLVALTLCECGDSMGDRWIPHTKGYYWGKRHIMASSWCIGVLTFLYSSVSSFIQSPPPPPPWFFLYFFLHFNNKWTHPNDNILHRWNSGWTRSLLGQLIVPYWQGSCACACLYFEVTMTSCNGNIFRVTGPFWGETNGCWWIPLTKARDGELWYFLWSAHEQAVEQTIETRVI